jgi:hypothetical protein
MFYQQVAFCASLFNMWVTKKLYFPWGLLKLLLDMIVLLTVP